MRTYLYTCDEGGPMVLGVDGTPPAWVTCPVGLKGLECTHCDAAKLVGPAPPFAGGVLVEYRCKSGHSRVLHLPSDTGLPETAQCRECDEMLMPVKQAPKTQTA